MQELFETLAPYLALAIIVIALARWIIRDRREERELDQVIRCGPGCICNGETVRERQSQPVYIQQPRQIIYIEEAPPIYIRARTSDVRYLSAPQAQSPQDYYADPEPIIERHKTETRHLPPSAPQRLLQPGQMTIEAQRAFEREKTGRKKNSR